MRIALCVHSLYVTIAHSMRKKRSGYILYNRTHNDLFYNPFKLTFGSRSRSPTPIWFYDIMK